MSSSLPDKTSRCNLDGNFYNLNILSLLLLFTNDLDSSFKFAWPDLWGIPAGPAYSKAVVIDKCVE